MKNTQRNIIGILLITALLLVFMDGELGFFSIKGDCNGGYMGYVTTTSGAPVSGATAWVEQYDERVTETTTDTSGFYKTSIFNCNGERPTLHIEKTGYKSKTADTRPPYERGGCIINGTNNCYREVDFTLTLTGEEPPAPTDPVIPPTAPTPTLPSDDATSPTSGTVGAEVVDEIDWIMVGLIVVAIGMIILLLKNRKKWQR